MYDISLTTLPKKSTKCRRIYYTWIPKCWVEDEEIPNHQKKNKNAFTIITFTYIYHNNQPNVWQIYQSHVILYGKNHLNQQIFKCPMWRRCLIQFCAPFWFKLPGTKRKSDCLPNVIIFSRLYGWILGKQSPYLVWIRFAVYQIVAYQGGIDDWWYPCLDVHKMPWKKVPNIFYQTVVDGDIPWLKAKNHREKNKKNK